MKELSRTQNSARNFILGTAMYILTQLISFVSRTVFIKLLGDQYLGISGLYSNILSLLALADLGVTTAFTFSLYKPLAEKDYNRIASLLGFFRKLFVLIAAIVLVIGLGFVPFLKFVIKDSTLEYEKLQLYFALSVINTASSYLLAYKSAVFRADQKVYVINEVSAITNLLLHVLQITVLYITRNYVFYLLAAIVITLLNNVILTVLSNRTYPQIFAQKPIPLPKEEKRHIFGNLRSLVVYRISAAIMSSTSNILISVLLGTVIVGYYSNYSMIITIITALISVLTTALLASIGNLGTTDAPERRGELFHAILLLFYGVGAFCSACFVSVFNDFIFLWLKDSVYLLSQTDVYLIVFAFFITCVSNPIWMFRESFGLFKKAKYVMSVAAVLNILIAIVGGKLFGVGGIIAAAGIARLLTMFWYEPKYLYKDAFNLPYKAYWNHTLLYVLQSVAVVCISVVLTSFLPTSMFTLFVKILICLVVSALVFVLVNIKTNEGKILLSKIKTIIKKEN